MLDLSWGHIFLVLVVALVVVGPKDLPRLMRTVGQWMGKARAMADQFRKSFDDMARQSEIESLRNERPLADVERELNRAMVPDDMKSPSVEIDPAAETAYPEPREGEFDGVPDPVAEPVSADGYEPPKP
jgi:sec-independent protein translocase protein TatB